MICYVQELVKSNILVSDTSSPGPTVGGPQTCDQFAESFLTFVQSHLFLLSKGVSFEK